MKGELPALSSFAYASGAGKCIVVTQAGSRPFAVYLVDSSDQVEGRARYFESHRTLKNAEAVARWMALGL
ncbi:MAG: hypothetical protein KC800_07895 [Candidatus Eremiobacteraeota bacterium]|nr:hypothetical protein [Candidatus Eremiobacteraeota bacterium]MCA9776621.1 hypothetical protein [Candidatus Eremiobacteraeota bacterium]